MTEFQSPPALKCTLHDWSTLRWHLIFAFTRTMQASEVDGTYERRGEYSAWRVRRGSIQLRSDGEEAIARPGDWLFCFGTRIVQRVVTAVELTSIRVANTWPDKTPLFASPRTTLAVPADQYPQLDAIAHRLTADYAALGWVFQGDPAQEFRWQTRMDFAAYLHHQRNLLDWTEAVAHVLHDANWETRIPRGVDARLAEVLNRLEYLPFDAPFPGDALNRLSGMTQGQLNRMCVRNTGLTTYGYWEQRRRARAEALLREPSVRIKAVAAELGFRQLPHFSTWFKRQVGQSPRAYVRTMRPAES